MNIFEEIKFENEFNKPVDKYFRKLLIQFKKMPLEQKTMAYSMYGCIRQLQGYLQEFKSFPTSTKKIFLDWLQAIYETYSKEQTDEK